MTTTAPAALRRPLFVATVLTGSFLLFVVQPMVARMALPQLGGAPNVWNSAMLVYQALLLGGYAYAHLLSRLPVARQATIHLALLVVAAVTLPIHLVALAPPTPGREALWVPVLFALSIGPVFFLVSAQAPLMQRWFSAHPQAGEPWALYAASNLGSFAGLIAYPLVFEPLLRVHVQAWAWSLGYALLIGLIVLAARARWNAIGSTAVAIPADPPERIGWRRVALWLALSAVPSGLMLSTTTHLTTDIFAMPLLWVIPLGLYLLSFVVAFAEKRGPARAITLSAPPLLLLAGGMAMVARNSGTLTLVLASIVLLFVIAVALHAKLYDNRPAASQLTLFYLVMSAGGALGGLFTALLAPLVFDWVWEHPLLVFAAAALVPAHRWYDWRRLPGLTREMVPVAVVCVLLFAGFLCVLLQDVTAYPEPGAMRLPLTLGIALCGMLVITWRWLFVLVLAMLMLAQGGLITLESSLQGLRTRSYFGIYTVRNYPDVQLRTLAHGTTLHGEQSTDPKRSREPMTYYGPSSGAAMVLSHAPALFGAGARIGVVGLGTGTLACFHQPGEVWHLFEIDPAVLHLSRNGTFTYLQDCAPDAKVILGDARLAIAKLPRNSFDVLAVDAFSSDAIPLHLLTDEAFGRYFDVLSPRGVLLVHISNRYIELEPVLAAEARHRGLAVALRADFPATTGQLTPSDWVIMTRDPAQLARLRELVPGQPLTALKPPASSVWTDDHASVLPYIRWPSLFRSDK